MADTGTIRTWGQELALTWRIARMRVSGQMQFQASFAMQLVGYSTITIMEIAAIVIFFQRFPSLGGWSMDEVLLLYAITGLTFDVADTIQNGLDHVPNHVRTGDFDRLMTRPLSIYLQALVLEVSLRHVSRLAEALGLFGWVWARLDLALDGLTMVLLASTLVCGIALFVALFTLGAIISFWTVGSIEVVNAVTYGGSDLAQYPIHIYRTWMQRAFTWLIPIAFVIYYPALIILDKPDPIGLAGVAPLLGPLLTLAFVLLVGWAWSRGVNHYHSTGS